MRGLNDKGKRVLVKSVSKSARADVVSPGDQVGVCGGELVRELWGGRYMD